MTDSELTKLAFKAAFSGADLGQDADMKKHFNPLTDDGDALRLAVKLNLIVASSSEFSESSSTLSDEKFNFPSLAQELWANNIDKFSATRRAIVRAAAAIGEKLNEELNKS